MSLIPGLGHRRHTEGKKNRGETVRASQVRVLVRVAEQQEQAQG